MCSFFNLITEAQSVLKTLNCVVIHDPRLSALLSISRMPPLHPNHPQEPERSGSVPNYDSPPPLLNTLLNKAPEAEGEYKSLGGGPPKVLAVFTATAQLLGWRDDRRWDAYTSALNA